MSLLCFGIVASDMLEHAKVHANHIIIKPCIWNIHHPSSSSPSWAHTVPQLTMRVQVVTTFVLLWTLALGAGIGVHLSILSRTLPNIVQFLRKDAVEQLQPGAFFPDCFYNCLGLSEEAEEAHWPPFLAAGLNHWKNRYSHLLDDPLWEEYLSGAETADWEQVLGNDRIEEFKNALRLRAFLFGVFTHQVTDVSWHSLGFQQGFLDMLKERDFEGDVEKAHEALDVGGDMILMARLQSADPDLSWLETPWDVPYSDISDIYKRLGSFVSKREIEYCMVQGKAALRAEKRFAGAGFRRYASLSPVLFSELETYYLGGIQEIARTVQHCAGKLAAWFHKKGDINEEASWDVCEAFAGKSKEINENEAITGQVKIHGITMGGLWRSRNDARLRHSMRDNFHRTKGLAALVKQSLLTMLPEVIKAPRLAINTNSGNEIFVSPLQHGSYFGSQTLLGEFDGSGETWIAVSAPFEEGSGSVYVMALDQFKAAAQENRDATQFFRLTSGEMDEEDKADIESSVYSGPARFGAQLARLKAPSLGNDILIVANPGRNKLVFHFKGRQVLVLKKKAPAQYGDGGDKQLGESLLVETFGGVEYVVVGSPRNDADGKHQRGVVELLSGERIINEITNALMVGYLPTLAYDMFVEYTLAVPREVLNEQVRFDDNEEVVKTEVGYELFGKTLAALNDTLLVGVAGVGAVVGYNYAWGQWRAGFVLRGSDDAGTSFGGDVLLTVPEKGLIAVGSSTDSSGNSCTQSGALYIFEVKNESASLVKKIEHIKTTNNMCESYSRFATTGVRPMSWGEGLQDSSDHIYVTSPFAYNNRGAVWRVDLTSWEVFEVPITGHAKYMASQFGQSLAVLESQNGEVDTLAVGMPFTGIAKLGEAVDINGYSPLSGGLYVVYV